MVSKVGRCVLAIVLLLGALTACAKPSSKALPVVRFVNFKVYDPAYVAIDKGFFAKRGIEVKIVGDVLAGPTAIQAVAGGSAEAGISSLPAIINANAAGLPIQAITDIQSALKGQPLEEFFVRADSGIKTLADVKGKKWAVNLWRSSFHYTALMALEQNKMSEKDVEFVLLSFDKQALALEQKQVDVIGLMEPYASQARLAYGDRFRVLFTAIDTFGTKQFSTHFVNRVWARERPEQVKAFTDGLVDAILWIEQNQNEARGIIAKYTGVDAKFVPDYHFQANGAVIMDDVQFWMDYLRKRGELTVDWLKLEDIATNSYNSRLGSR